MGQYHDTPLGYKEYLMETIHVPLNNKAEWKSVTS